MYLYNGKIPLTTKLTIYFYLNLLNVMQLNV